MLTQERVKELLNYDPASGNFTWLVSRRCVRAGSAAGYKINLKSKKTYIGICIDVKRYLAHRIAFLYMNGYMPKREVDHINGNSSDNRWENLRDVSRVENMRNCKIFRNNSSGVCGVSWVKSRSKWHATIMLHGKTKHIGYFDDISKAFLARQNANIEHGFHVNHGSDRTL